MIHCLMVGDSLAVGVGQFRPECETIAQVGINSDRYVASMLPPGQTTVGTAVISLGVNDDASLDTLENLREVRARVAGGTVYWLLPGLKDRVRAFIRTVAEENGDRLIDTRPQAGRDHLHPTGAGYQTIAAKTVGDDGGTDASAFIDPPSRPMPASAPHGRHARGGSAATLRLAHATPAMRRSVRIVMRAPASRPFPLTTRIRLHGVRACTAVVHGCTRRADVAG